MATTPDVEQDVLELLASLVPADVVIAGASRNAWAGDVRPAKNSGIPMQAAFVMMTGAIYDHSNDGNTRTFMLDILVRGGRNDDSATEARARRIHDALAGTKGHRGPWAGPTSLVAYLDVTPVALQYLGPGQSDETFALVQAEVWYDG